MNENSYFSSVLYIDHRMKQVNEQFEFFTFPIKGYWAGLNVNDCGFFEFYQAFRSRLLTGSCVGSDSKSGSGRKKAESSEKPNLIFLDSFQSGFVMFKN